MARRIIILEGRAAARSFRVAFWPDVPVSRRSFYASPDNRSQYKDASAAELTSLRDGLTVEVVEELAFAATDTVNQIKAKLVTRFGEVQAVINGKNEWDRYGTAYDDATSTWTDQVVA